MSDAIRFETANLRWWVEFGHQGRHTTAIITRARVAGDPGCQQFADVDTDQDALLQRIRQKIEQLDGPIRRTDN